MGHINVDCHFLVCILLAYAGNPDLKKQIYVILLFSYLNPHNM